MMFLNVESDKAIIGFFQAGPRAGKSEKKIVLAYFEGHFVGQ